MKIDWNRIADGLLDVVFPRRCPVCDHVMAMGNRSVCPECKKSLVFVGSRGCRKCGRLLIDSTAEYCDDCKNIVHAFDRAFSAFVYNDAFRKSVFRFKNGGRQEYADFYAEALYRIYGAEIRAFDADAIVPVPLHKSKMKERGYNQAELIASKLAKKLYIPMCNNRIIRVNRATAQKTLGASQRRKNLKKAFIIKGNDVKLKRVIIVDDVYTTGSTIDEISVVLKRHGTEKVLALTVASGTPV